MENNFALLDSSARTKQSSHCEDDFSKQDQYEALLAFLGTFPTVGEVHKETLYDGVQLLDCLCEISPDYFQPELLHRQQLDNYFLRHSNLRKLVRHVEVFFATELHRSIVSFPMNDFLTAVAKGNATPFFLLQLVAVAAVQHNVKTVVVKRILSQLSPHHQAALHSVLQDTLLHHCPELTKDKEDPTWTMTETETQEEEDTSSHSGMREEHVIREEKRTSSESSPSKRTTPSIPVVTPEKTPQPSSLPDDDDDARSLQQANAALEDALLELQQRYEGALDEAKQLADELDVAKIAQHDLYRAQAKAALYKRAWEAEVSELTATVATLEDQLQTAGNEPTAQREAITKLKNVESRSAFLDDMTTDYEDLLKELTADDEHRNEVEEDATMFHPRHQRLDCRALDTAETEPAETATRLKTTQEPVSSRRGKSSRRRQAGNGVRKMMRTTIRDWGLGMI